MPGACSRQSRSSSACVQPTPRCRLGNIHWRLAALLSVGAVAGAAAGSAAAVHSPPGVLEGCFTVAMLLLARMTFRSVAVVPKK